MTASLLSIVVPVYCSERTLPTLCARLEEALKGAPFELILVDDCSKDESWRVIAELSRRLPWVRGIRLARNFGQQSALLCGVRAAKGDVIVTIDDDLQNPPEEIPNLLAKLGEGYDVVYGVPAKQTHGLLRNLASRITKIALQSVMSADTAGHASAFRAFRTSLRDAFDHYRSPTVVLDVLLTWGTHRFTHIAVRQDARMEGQSGYTLKKLIIHAITMITSFSTFPLQIASLLGFAFSLLGFFVLLYVLGNYFFLGHSVPGFAFIASIVVIFSGVQLFALGIFGEYLARMHFRMMDRPSYAVATMTDEEKKKDAHGIS